MVKEDERFKIMRLRNMMKDLDTTKNETVFNFVESYCDIRGSNMKSSLEEIKLLIIKLEEKMVIELGEFKKSIEEIRKVLGMNGYGN